MENIKAQTCGSKIHQATNKGSSSHLEDERISPTSELQPGLPLFNVDPQAYKIINLQGGEDATCHCYRRHRSNLGR